MRYVAERDLFSLEYFEQMPRFYELLTGSSVEIYPDSVQKIVLFPSNSAYMEDQTLGFFREVDKKNGDFFVRSIVGCGYDMYQCIPQLIANLLK